MLCGLLLYYLTFCMLTNYYYIITHYTHYMLRLGSVVNSFAYKSLMACFADGLNCFKHFNFSVEIYLRTDNQWLVRDELAKI